MTANRPNLLKLLAPLAAFAGVFVLLMALSPSSDIELPQRGAGVDTAIPPGASTDQRIALLQRAARAGVADPPAYASLGDAYLQKARDTGDPSYYSRADRSFGRGAAAVTPATSTPCWVPERSPDSATTSASSCASAARPAGSPPASPRRCPVIADAQIELGRYEAAERTLQRMLDAKPNLTSYARVSYFRELNGDLEGALQSMRLAVSAGAAASENVAYLQTLIGDLELQRNRPAAARTAYRSALARLPGYAPAEAGLARVDNAAGDLDGAARRLRDVAGRLPLTSHLILLADTDAARGAERAAARDLDVVRAQQRLLRGGRHEAGRRADRLRGHSRRPASRGATRPPAVDRGAQRAQRRCARLGSDPGRPARGGPGLVGSRSAPRYARAALPPARRAGGEGRRAGRAGASGAARGADRPRRSFAAAGARRTHGSGGAPMRRALAVLLALAAVLVAAPGAMAHPLGNFSINHLSTVKVSDDRVDVLYVLDEAEIPTTEQRDLSRTEIITRKQAELRRNLTLTVDGRRVALRPLQPRLSFPPGQAGLETAALRAAAAGFAGATPNAWRCATTPSPTAWAGRPSWRSPARARPCAPARPRETPRTGCVATRRTCSTARSTGARPASRSSPVTGR